MIPTRYFVVKCDGHWRVEFNSVYGNGLHEDKKEAIQSAIQAARKTAEAGSVVEVLVQTEDKLWSTEWSSRDETPKAAAGAT